MPVSHWLLHADHGLAPIWRSVTRGPLAELFQQGTTRREAYEAFAKPTGCWHLVLFNEDGELTEGSFGNIALKLTANG